MQLTLKLDLENAAFAFSESDWINFRDGGEIARILRKLAEHFNDVYVVGHDPHDHGTLRDSNGNTVGEWRIGE